MSVKLKFLLTFHALAFSIVLMICAVLGKLACVLGVRKGSRRAGADP